MRYTFQLYLHYRENNSDVSLQVNELLRNWDDVQLAFKRNDYDGVVRSFTTSFDFVGEARALVISQYLADGLRADVSVEYKALQENGTYSRLFICGLDFSTLQYDDYSAKISAIDDSATAKIKANRSTQYEFTYADLTDSWLQYSGFPCFGECGHFYQKVYGVIEAVNYVRYMGLGMVYDYQQEPEYGESNAVVSFSTNSRVDASLTGLYRSKIFEASAAMNIDVDVAVKVRKAGSNVPVEFGIARETTGGVATVLDSVSLGTSWSDVSLSASNVSMAEKDVVFPYIKIPANAIVTIQTKQDEDNYFRVSWQANDGAECTFPIVKLKTLGKELLKKVIGHNYVDFQLQSTQQYLNNDWVWLTSEGFINRRKDGILSTSWDDFSEWLKNVFGLVEKVEDNNMVTVTFADRNNSIIFDENSTTAKDEFTEFDLKIQKNLIYSDIVVGYEKSDVEAVGASDDFCNGTVTYSTGIKNLQKTLNIKSPYKCSPWVIEQACRQKDSTSNDAGQVFFLAAYWRLSDEVCWLITKDNEPPVAPTVGGVRYANKYFNAAFSPKQMLLNNTDLIAPCADSLTETNFEGNANATVDGVSVSGNITGISGVYGCEELSFETSDNAINPNWSGLFEVENQGLIYRGWLKDVAFSVAHPEKVKYTLIVKEITENS